MYDINQSIRSGRITAAPDLRTSTDGRKNVRFSLAVNRGERVNFFNYTAFDEKLVELLRRCSKGTWLTVIGYDEINSYEKNGNVQKYFNTICREIYFNGQKMANGEVCRPPETKTEIEADEDDAEVTLPASDDDLPF